MNPDSTGSSRSEKARERSTTYGFLAWLFLDTPDVAFVARMSDTRVLPSGPSWPAGERADPGALGGLEAMRDYLAGEINRPAEEVCAELAVQRTRLFRGVAPGYGPRPPYESVYRRSDSRAQSDVLLQVHGFYREAGAQLPADRSERLDYLGLELDLMRFLSWEEGRSWEEGEEAEATRLRDIQRRFLAHHLLAWVPAYCEAILGEPDVPFYHGVARLLSGFLAEEADHFGVTVAR